MFAATYKLIADPDPVNGDDTKLLGNAIGFYTPRTPWVAFVQQPQSQSATSGGNSVTFSAQGTNAPALVPGDTGDPRGYALNTVTNSLIYQWYKNGVAIPGANRSSYTQVPILTSDSGAQFTVGIRALGFADNALNPIWSNSTPATLTVITDNVPPTISYAATFVNTNQPTAPFVVNVTFSEWMDSATLGNAINYTIAGSTITNVTVGSDHKTVQLLVTAPPTLPLNVTVSGVKDLTGNTIVASSSAAINPEKLTFSDIGTIGADPAYPTIAWVTGVGGYIISAQGSDIWGAADAFNFAWEQKTGDFDAVVRSVSITKTANAAKAGLMVREDLSPSSRNWDIVNDPASADGITAVDGSGLGANNVECNYRGTNGIGTAGWKSAGAIVPTYPNAWVRLKRTGTLLEAFSSSNRVDWVRLAGYDTATNLSGALPSQVYVGLCTTAHNNDPVVDPAPTTFKYYNTAQYADYTSSFVPSPPRPTLSFSVSGGNMSISWTPAGGHLEASPALGAGGNWQSLGTANPASVPIGPNAQFFRVVTP